MFVSISRELYSDFLTAIERKYWENDQNMLEYIERRTTSFSFILSQYTGIYLSSLNPSLSFPFYIKTDRFPSYLYLNSKVDKRSKHLKKICNSPASNWYNYSYEELENMTELERNEARESIPNKFHFFNSYGVVDSVEQFYTIFKFLNVLDAKYVAFLTPIKKSEQPSNGGWRWHKWGEYLGKQKRSGCEYLYNEPNIDLVYVYHIYEVTSILEPILSSDLLDIYKKGNSLYIYNKQNELVFDTRYNLKLNYLTLGREEGKYTFLKTFTGNIEENLESILKYTTDVYSQYLKDQSLPLFKEKENECQ